jgi:hypothetical protein
VSSDILVIEAGRTERDYWKDPWRYPALLYLQEAGTACVACLRSAPAQT